MPEPLLTFHLYPELICLARVSQLATLCTQTRRLFICIKILEANFAYYCAMFQVVWQFCLKFHAVGN